MLNIASLILGVCAWLFGGMAISTNKGSTSHRNTFISFSLCAISLVLQLFEINRRVIFSDYSAIEDTIRAILIASVGLIFITIVLNVVALLKIKHK